MAPLMVIFFALRATARFGWKAQKDYGKGLAVQWREQVAIGMRYRILPRWYYIYELFRDDHLRRASHYINRFETKHALYWMLKGGTAVTPLQDKQLFTQHCNRHGIPAIPVLASFRDEATQCLAEDLPACDLFLKPMGGRGGVGAELWLLVEDKTYVDRSKRRLTAVELIAHAQLLSRRRPFILQRRIVNHPEFLPLSPSALSTMRIVTFTNEADDIEVVRAVFRMGQAVDSVVDNFHSGGIAARIDLETGELGLATDMGLKHSIGWIERHPATGAQIAGYQLPVWKAAQQLAIRAHHAFRGRVLIGWDIAWTPDGLIVVEGNAAPDVDNIQRPHREPLGDSRFGELLAWHLKQSLEARKAKS
jgi:putative polysaccharide biosynthesis protein